MKKSMYVTILVALALWQPKTSGAAPQITGKPQVTTGDNYVSVPESYISKKFGPITGGNPGEFDVMFGSTPKTLPSSQNTILGIGK